MSFADAITRFPIGHDQDHVKDMADHLSDLPEALRDLCAQTAGCSPYLRSLMQREAEFVYQISRSSADAAVEDTLSGISKIEFSDLKPELRRIKRQIALLTALADLGGIWRLEQVTSVLTQLAEQALDHALQTLVGREIARGKLPGMSEGDAADAAGMCILAMGKMGAYELNYSSDIDLICLFDETRYAPDDYHEVRASFIRVTRALTAIMADVTGDGYVFRTDLRLRPDASVTPVCIAMETAERYYESVGRTWERAAFIKARPCAGDIAAGERFLQRLTPFVWRKHLDFAAIQDAHDMRLRIRDHKGLARKIELSGHNMKLGFGGIREIEFFTQTRQLIAGGRDPNLRVRGTIEGLDRLAQAEWIDVDAAAQLTAHYRSHREVEHRLQMIGDAQTHDLPSNSEGFDVLARFSGEENTSSFQTDLTEKLHEVATLTEAFFAPEETGENESVKSYLERWHSFPALRSERAVASFKRLFPPMLNSFQAAADPSGALNTFEQFLRGLPAGVQVFSLFEANPSLGRLIVDICTASPALATYLGRNARVLDAVIGGTFFEPWPGKDVLRDSLVAELAQFEDYETKLDATRRWQKEWHFRIGVHHLQGLISPEDAGAQYADLAEAVVCALLPVVNDHVAKRHGKAPGRGAVVVGMGSLGAGKLTSRSDLDLIVVYDADGVEASDGPRPLATRSYFARVTQTLVTALSAPTAEGRLYEVDMRLRPSGQSGPVATSLQSFESYQKNEAWVWEHLALTRARPFAGDETLVADVDAVRSDVLQTSGKDAVVRKETQEMRDRLAQAGQHGIWDVKAGPGGAQDIDLFAQAASLAAGSTAMSSEDWLASAVVMKWCSSDEAEALSTARKLFWRTTQASRLSIEGTFDPQSVGAGGVALMLRDTECDSIDNLIELLEKCRNQAKEVIDRVMAQP